MEPKLILMERVEKAGERSSDWWKENVPNARYTPEYQYRKRGLKYFDIKSVIQLTNTKNECMILCYDGEEIIVQGTFSELYDKWVELGEFDDDDFDENSY